jgi:hypothetical protein
MIQALKQENYLKDNQINEMENTILHQKKETAKIKDVLSEALKARKAARTRLNEVKSNNLKLFLHTALKLILDSRLSKIQ